MNIVEAAGKREQQDVDRQNKKQHRERGEIPFASAIENFDNHLAWAGKQVLKCKPDTAIFAQQRRLKVFPNEFQREASRLGTLSAFGAELPLELGAAVEAMGGFHFGLYLVFHLDSVLTGQR